MNNVAKDELKAHTSMFAPGKNPGYYNMLPMARDRIVSWVDKSWYEDMEKKDEDDESESREETDAAGGAEKGDQEEEEEAEAEMTT